MTFTSPKTISIASLESVSKNSVERTIQLSGQFVVDSVDDAKKLRDELVSMGNGDLFYPFTWTGDELIEGYAKCSGVSVDSSKLASGLFNYSITLNEG